MHKQSTKGSKEVQQRNLKNNFFFLIKKKRLICFLTFSSWTPSLEVFKKLGWSGDGKRNLLFGWPKNDNK